MKQICILYCIVGLSFILGIHDGHLALWRGEDPKPAVIYPCNIDSFPEADRKILEKGINIATQQELTMRLEDYLS